MNIQGILLRFVAWIEWLVEVYRGLHLHFRKKWGDLRGVNYESQHPQILHIYYFRVGVVEEPWDWKTYQRWNRRLEERKVLRGSEWFLDQWVQRMDGIIIIYRFRGHEHVDSINWVRGGKFCRTREERLELLRNWMFPRWSMESWKEDQIKKLGPPRFPNEVQLQQNGRMSDDLLAKWKPWFGPEGRCESFDGDEIRIRHPREWFDMKMKSYLMGPDQTLVVSRGLQEESYTWKRET